MSLKLWCGRFAFSFPLLIALSSAIAQSPEPRVTFALTGGVAKGPQEPYKTGTMGYSLGASMELRTPVRQLRLRPELLFADWQTNQVMALSGTVVLAPLQSRAVAPYLLVGAGGYKSPSESPRAGWNLGAGLRFDVGGRKVLVESRIHTFRIAHGVPLNLPSSSRLGPDWRTVWTPISLGFAF